MCSSFVSAILMEWNLFQNKNWTTPLPSISKRLIIVPPSGRWTDTFTRQAHKEMVGKDFEKKDKVEVQSTTESKSVISCFRNKDKFNQRIVAVGRLHGPCVQSTCSYLRQRNLCTRVVHSVLLRTLCVPSKLVHKGKVGSRSVIVGVFHLFWNLVLGRGNLLRSK